MKPLDTGLGGFRSPRRALLLLAPSALAAGILSAQTVPQGLPGSPAVPGQPQDDDRMPNGKSRREAIVKADYDDNLKDARELMDLAKSFELDLEKDDRYVLSLSSLKKLDEMEKLTKRIRGRLKRN